MLAGFPFLFVVLQIGRRNVSGARAVANLVNAEEAVAQLEHVVAQRDDDELGVAGPLLDVVGDDGDVLEVEGRVDLVHDVDGS